MCVEIQESRAPFYQSFSLASAETSTEIHEPESLKKMRQKCFERFLEVAIPASKDESFEYLQLKSLFAMPLEKAGRSSPLKEDLLGYLYPECKNSFLTFVNGSFCQDLSDCSLLPKGFLVMPFSQAMKMFSALMNSSFAKILKEETDSFALLNAACHQEGVFLYLPPKMELSHPVQVLSIIDEAHEGSWIMPRLHLFAGAFSSANIVSRTVCHQGQKYFYNSIVDIALEDGAKVQYSIDDLGLPLSQSWLFESFRITQKPSSTFKGFQLTQSEKSRRDWKVALAGAGADVQLNGAWLLNGNKEAHINVIVDHQEPYCQSMQLFKGVLNDTSSSSFQGKILVQQKATKTVAYQINKNLCLSDQVQANSKPNLEINSPDVKASHGSATGQLDAEQLFYLKTRGVSDQQARNCMINSFCHEVVGQLFIASQLQNFRNHLSEYVKI